MVLGTRREGNRFNRDRGGVKSKPPSVGAGSSREIGSLIRTDVPISRPRVPHGATTTVVRIVEWMAHRNLNVPTELNVRPRLAPCEINPEKPPVSKVSVC